MTDGIKATVEGHEAASVRLWVGNIGPWFADVDFTEEVDLPDHVTILIGTLKLIGTVARSQSGKFGLQFRCRIVAGGGGWSSELKAKAYHNDAGVKALSVATDAAREAGETLEMFVPTKERVGNDYVRQVGPAARALEDALAGAAWWVDYDGVTQAGPRTATSVPKDAYQVLAFDPRSRVATLAVDDIGAVRIGSILTERLDAPQTVREIEVTITGTEAVRMNVWCGGTETSYAHLAGLLRAIATRATDQTLLGKYRYRVVRMASERVELQAVRKDAGLPDVLPLSMWPGVAGVHAELAPGAEVLVEFIEGDRAQPIVTHFAGKDGVGFVPVSLTLGGADGAPCARQGDTVDVLLPPAIFSGVIGIVPATGVLTFPMAKTLGVITSGSGKVNVA